MKKIPMKRPFAVVKLQQGVRLAWESHAEPMSGTAQQPVEVGAGELGVMFLGHSSFLLQMEGANVLIDPVFATRLIVLRRQRRPGIKVDDLPPIDIVLLTHAHMDHLNRPTLRRIVRATRNRTGNAPIVIVPSGVEDLVSDLRKNFTIVIVTHNMQQAARVSQQTAFFYMGRLIEVGDTSTIFTKPREKETEDYITGRFG